MTAKIVIGRRHVDEIVPTLGHVPGRVDIADASVPTMIMIIATTVAVGVMKTGGEVMIVEATMATMGDAEVWTGATATGTTTTAGTSMIADTAILVAVTEITTGTMVGADRGLGGGTVMLAATGVADRARGHLLGAGIGTETVAASRARTGVRSREIAPGRDLLHARPVVPLLPAAGLLVLLAHARAPVLVPCRHFSSKHFHSSDPRRRKVTTTQDPLRACSRSRRLPSRICAASWLPTRRAPRPTSGG